MKKTLHFLNELPWIIAGAALAFAVSLSFANAVMRYFFSSPIVGTDEIIVVCFSWAVFLGAAAAYKRGMHFGIDMVVNMLPQSAKRVIDIIVRAILLLMTGYMTYLSWEMTLGAWKITPNLKIPYTYLYLSMAIGFALMAIYSVGFLINALRKNPDSEGGGEE